MAERARSGDMEAFGELIRRHREHAFGWARSMAGDETLAEDIVQEALVKAFLHVGQLVEPNRFLGWLRQIVKNEANMKLRRGGPYRRERPLSSFSVTGESGTTESDERVLERLLDRLDMSSDSKHGESEPMKHFLRHESNRLIRSLLQCLNERERGMFEAYFFMQCSAEEVAGLFRTTPGSVHTYLYRSKKKIQEAMRRERVELNDWNPESTLLRKRSLSILTGQSEMNNTFVDRIAKLLRSRGEQAAMAEVAGRSGHSFRLKLSHKTTYADGVFVFDWKQDISNLFAQYGYEPTFLTGQLEGSPVPLHPVSMLFDVVRMDEETVMEFIRSSIDRGSPVLFFDTYVERPFVHEWNLIFAYNDLERMVEATDVVAPYRKKVSYSQLAASPLRFYCNVKKTNRPVQPIDPLHTLKTIVRSMREGDGYIHQTVYASYISGLRAYDTWIRHLEEGPRVANAYGHRYMSYSYASARSFAGRFLRTLTVERYVEALIGNAASLFDQAAGLLREASSLSPLLDMFDWNAEVVHKTIDVLKKVAQAEEQALLLLEESIRILEAKSKQWEANLDEQ
jgi:RNA polymerase sigma factor (sigma-70 family)